MIRRIVLLCLLASFALGAPLLLGVGAGPAHAFISDEALSDPVLEARARALSRQLRCLVCQNQSIEESDADLARDLRRIVREEIAAGKTDQQVLDYVVARYGDWVLLNPPFKARTYLLWFGPLGIFLAGAIGVVVFLRHNRDKAKAAPLKPLNEAERQRLDELLSDDAEKEGPV